MRPLATRWGVLSSFQTMARSLAGNCFSRTSTQVSLVRRAPNSSERVTVLVPLMGWRRRFAPIWSLSTHEFGYGSTQLVTLIDISNAKVAALPLEALTPVPDVIERARSGDRSAFGELYDQHVDAVYRYVLYRVREPSDAEDLTSEVFTRAFANIHRYRWQGKSFLAWLYTIARNAVTDRRRRDRPTVDLDNAYGVAEDGPTAHERAVHGEAVDALRGAVKHLTAEQQEVIVLRFVENLSSRQVAKVLGKNEGAIRALQFRALGRLRKLLTSEVA